MPHPLALSFGVSLLLLCACRQNAQTPAAAAPAPVATAEEQLAHIKTLQKDIFPNGIDAGTDTARAWPFIRAVEVFAEAYPANEHTPNLLLDAAGLANGTDWANKSIQLWGYVWRRTPDHPRAPEAMFYQGFVMDTKFGNYPLAIEYYDRLMTTYPESPFAEQALGLKRLATGDESLPGVPEPPSN